MSAADPRDARVLAKQVAVLTAILDELDDAIVLRDADGAVVFQNRAARLPEVAASDSPFITAKRVLLHVAERDDGTWATSAVDDHTRCAGSSADVSRLGADTASTRGRAGAASDSEHRLLVRSAVSHRSPVVSCILEAVPHSAFTATAQGNLAYENRKTLELTGALTGELAGLGWLDKVHPDDRPRVSEAWRATVATGCNLREEFRLQCASGGFRWCLGAASPVVNDDGIRVKFIGAITDINDQRTLRQQVEDERALLLTVVDQLPVGICISSPAGAPRLLNKKFHDIWGYNMLRNPGMGQAISWTGALASPMRGAGRRPSGHWQIS
jgi:PAS domain S-box-containing protein